MSISRTIIINAAGMGSRLGLGYPKTLVKINKKPIIHWILKALKKEKNIRIVVGYKLKEVIQTVIKIRKDIIFVNNKNFENTGTAGSFLLACKHLNTNEVISVDGDLVIKPKDLSKIICCKEECIGVTKPSTDNLIFVEKKIIKKKNYLNKFTSKKTPFEWSGLFKIKLKNINQHSNNFHIFEMLKNVKTNFRAIDVNSMDFDTSNDLKKLRKNFKKIYL